MIIYWVVLVLLTARLLGGRFKNLARLNLWGGGWLPGIALVQLSGLLLRQALPWLSVILVVGSYAALLLVGWMNRRLPGMTVLLAGIALNFLVITANGGTMPVPPSALQAIGRAHTVEVSATGQDSAAKLVTASKDSATDTANLSFLGDVIVVPLPGRMASVISIGDLFIAAGIAWLGWRAMGLSFWPESKLLFRL